MNPSTSRIGFWAAVLATVFGFVFTAAEFASLGHLLAPPWDTFWLVAPSIFLAWTYMVLMACVLDAAPTERRIWATIGFGFALIYAALNSIVYFTVLAVVIPHILMKGVRWMLSFPTSLSRAGESTSEALNCRSATTMPITFVRKTCGSQPAGSVA